MESYIEWYCDATLTIQNRNFPKNRSLKAEMNRKEKLRRIWGGG